jgi:hypothetical protein
MMVIVGAAMALGAYAGVTLHSAMFTALVFAGGMAPSLGQDPDEYEYTD